MFAQEALGDQTQGSVGINSGMQFPDIFGRLMLAGGVRNLGTKSNFDEGTAGFDRHSTVTSGPGSICSGSETSFRLRSSFAGSRSSSTRAPWRR